ncbi:MAG: hypothetical protein Q9191_000947 [Dirinaria sp. TL-2023a]
MLFRFANTIFRHLFPACCASRTAVGADPEEQIQSELAAAARQGMVATRSQDHTPEKPDDVDQITEFDSAIPSVKSQKRRDAQEAGIANQRDQVKKRRTSGAKERSGISASKKAVHQEKSESRHQADPPVLPHANGTERPNDGIEVRIVTERGLPANLVNAGDSTHAAQSLEPDAPHSVLDIAAERQEQRDATALSESTRQPADKSTRDVDQTPKAAHKKFSEEEALLLSTTSTKDSPKDEMAQTTLLAVNDETASDDEAPETVTTQKAKEKRKRKELDTRLKNQVKAAKKSRSSLVKIPSHSESPISPETLLGNMQNPLSRGSSSSGLRREPLPRLLPEELLNAEPVARPLAHPPLPVVKSDVAKKRKLSNIPPKPPKDIQKGAYKIRVLPAISSNLPPKSSTESKVLRESWLLGHRGPKGGVERRKMGGGFIRTKQQHC